MTQSNLRIADLDEGNVEDALNVCTLPETRNDKNIKIGCTIRKKWLKTSTERQAHAQKSPI